MSIEQISKYIKSTPGNTNPNVVKSMVAAENRKAVYEEVQVLKDAGAVGDWELREIFSIKKEEMFEDDDGLTGFFSFACGTPLKEGEGYVIQMNDKKYDCVCEKYSKEDMTFYFLTNSKNLTSSGIDFLEGEFVIGYAPLITTPITKIGYFIGFFGGKNDFILNKKITKSIKGEFLGQFVGPKNTKTLLQTSLVYSEDEKASINYSLGAPYGLELGKKYLVKTSSMSEPDEAVCKMLILAGELAVYYLGNSEAIKTTMPTDIPLIGEGGSEKTYLVADWVYDESAMVTSYVCDFNGGNEIIIKAIEEDPDLNYDKLKGQLGHSQVSHKQIVNWDGEPIGQSYFESNFSHGSSWTYRYLDYPIDPNSITSLTWSVTEGLWQQMNFITEECFDSKNRKYFVIKRSEGSTFNFMYISDEGFSIANKAGTVVEVPRGTYVCKNMDGWVSKVIAKVEEISKIDRKYLPEGVGYDVTEPVVLGKDYYVSDLNDHVDINHGGRIFYSLAAPKMNASKITGIKAETLFGGIETYGPEDFEIKTEQDKNGVPYTAIYAGGYYYAYVLILDQSTTFEGSKNNSYTEEDILLPPGTYVLLDYNNGYKVKELHSGTITKNIPIKQEYIPTMDSVTLKGENGKLYKLYIDSTGALKTQEI